MWDRQMARGVGVRANAILPSLTAPLRRRILSLSVGRLTFGGSGARPTDIFPSSQLI
jgi:hypothetical protein